MFSRTRGYLPHQEAHQASYFVTFRLVDSLPSEKLTQWKEELRILRAAGTPDLATRKHLRRIEEYMDEGHGRCWLSHPSVAEIVKRELQENDGKRYILHAWTIMPNHVHAVITLLGSNHLAAVLKSWKGASSFHANRILGRTGPFWQREYFERWIRSDRHFHYCVRYTLNNPVKARLCAQAPRWPWSGVAQNIAEEYGPFSA